MNTLTESRAWEIMRRLLARRWFKIVTISIGVFSIVSLMTATNIFQGNELLLLDNRFTSRKMMAAPAIDTSIVTIDWDEVSIDILGRWPWTWDRHARLINFLKAYNAREVGIVDDQFSTAGTLTFSEEASHFLKDQLLISSSGNGAGHSGNGAGHSGSSGNASEIANALPHYNEDLAAAMAALGRVFLCADFLIPEDQDNISGSGKVLMATDMKPPVDLLKKNILGLGFNRILQDPDGVIRRTPAMVMFKGKIYPSLVVAMAARRFGCPVDKIRYVPGQYIEFPGGRYPDGRPARMPVDDKGCFNINWTGGYYDNFLHFPFYILAEHIALSEGKAALRGYVPRKDTMDTALHQAASAMVSTRIVTRDDAEFFSGIIMNGIIAEYYFLHGGSFDDFLQYLGGQDPDGLGREFWNTIAINNTAATAFDAGDTPDYAQILTRVGAQDTDLFRENYAQTLFMHSKGVIDDMRPLYFLGRTTYHVTDSKAFAFSPLDLQNKSVFVGLTATALNSLNPTPFEKRYPMMGMQPDALNTITTGQFIREQPFRAQYVYIAVYSLLIVALVMRLGTVGQLASMIGLAGAHVGSAWMLFAKNGIVIPVVTPVLSIVLAYIVTVLFRYLEEQKERRKVRGLFSAMVSPEVLHIMEEHPEKFSLAGEKKDATMFSSDVSGFTTISEGVTAQELADILNIYLTPMSNIIMKYGGYVDKYEGDAIKAVFGVPLPDENHPWKASCSALEQQEELTAIARMLLLKYGVTITARMGVNTGIVSAGNMGSDKKMQYTVMGEQVTLAEELEPVNKLYESWIALGSETTDRSRDIIETRHLDTVIMGPSHHAIGVHEAMGWNRARYMEYWKDRPVPPLFIEGWRKMTPEKALGYVYYYQNKNLPESAMKSEIETLFFGLSPVAQEAMNTIDTLQTLELRDAMTALGELAAKNRPLVEDVAVPPYLSAEVAAVEAKLAAAAEDWQRVIWQWKKQLRENTIVAELMALKSASDSAGWDKLAHDIDKEELFKQIDTLDKRTECALKRCSFPKPSDEIAWNLAQHLKKILVDVGRETPEFLASDRHALRKHIVELQKKITDTMNVFLKSLQGAGHSGVTSEKTRSYHEFMADHCAISDDKKHLRDIFDRARKLYLAQDWDGAERIFKEALVLDPLDGPSTKYIERIGKLRKTPPPPDWNGNWTEE